MSEPKKHLAAAWLTPDAAVGLAEELLRWAATQDPQPQGRRDWTSLESRIASHLWNISALRHGLFSPPQFSDLCEKAIREFFQKPPHENPPAAPPA